MVVDLKPSQPKPEPGEEEKKGILKDWIPISIPAERKKKAGCGLVCVLILIAIVAAIAVGTFIAGYYGTKSSGKRAKIYSKEKDWEKSYKYSKVHGKCACSDYEETKEKAIETYEDWYNDIFRQYEEYIVENSDKVYTMEVKAWCNAPTSYFVMDLNKGYTAMKINPKNRGYHCVLVDNDAFLSEAESESLKQLDYSTLDQEFDLPIQNIISHFFEYGEPVPITGRDVLGEAVNALCPVGTPFYFMISGDATFKAQVQHLMDAHDIEYDDIFYHFVEIYEALNPLSLDELDDVTSDYFESMLFMPDGYYGGHVSPSGVGWSLNVDTKSFYARGYPFDQVTHTFGWNGTLLPPSDE